MAQKSLYTSACVGKQVNGRGILVMVRRKSRLRFQARGSGTKMKAQLTRQSSCPGDLISYNIYGTTMDAQASREREDDTRLETKSHGREIWWGI
jgi:hypothetical protein